jgi:predicted cupin superfamily sugar epimerase
MDASTVIENLQLIPHPEGGFFREIFRTDSITTIYFLLQNDDFSGFHRLQSHEIWYFHSGVPLNIYVIEKWQSENSFPELSSRVSSNYA